MKLIQQKINILAVSLSTILLAGCNSTMPQQNSYSSPSYSSSSYSAPSYSYTNEILGVVVSTRTYETSHTQLNTTGAVVGGLAGGVLGNQVGKGSGRAAATVLGTLVGAGVGSHVNSQKRPILMHEVVVRSVNGQYFTIQTQDDYYYQGKRVIIRQSGNNVEIHPF